MKKKEPIVLKRQMDTPERIAFWKAVDEIAARVEKWPAWMRGATK